MIIGKRQIGGLGQRGAVLAEMVIVTPFLVFLVLATADLSRALVDHNTLTKAIRNGARFIAANAYEGTTGTVSVSATLESDAKNLIVYGTTAPALGATPVLPGLVASDINVTHIPGTDDIEITVSHTIGGLLGPVLPFFYGGGGLNTTRDLRATVTMRAL